MRVRSGVESHTASRSTGSGGLWCRMEIPSSISQVQDVEEKIIPQCRRFSYTDRDLFALKLAIEEAITNAVKHGNKNDPEKHVRIKYRVTPRRVDVVIEDEGSGFNPAVLPDCTCNENICSPHGRGILLMRAFMNSVVFNPAGNTVTLTKLNATPTASAPARNVAFG
jgi:serine/threonine-protein kinase RsbW